MVFKRHCREWTCQVHISTKISITMLNRSMSRLSTFSAQGRLAELVRNCTWQMPFNVKLVHTCTTSAMVRVLRRLPMWRLNLLIRMMLLGMANVARTKNRSGQNIEAG